MNNDANVFVIKTQEINKDIPRWRVEDECLSQAEGTEDVGVRINQTESPCPERDNGMWLMHSYQVWLIALITARLIRW